MARFRPRARQFVDWQRSHGSICPGACMGNRAIFAGHPGIARLPEVRASRPCPVKAQSASLQLQSRDRDPFGEGNDDRDDVFTILWN